jgi:RNA recognition motif-containing protein
MQHRLYIGNLSHSATEDGLRLMFGRFGTVRSATIVTDKIDGRRRRFGFVEMSTDAEVRSAISRLNMTQYEDTVMSVSQARIDQ